MTVAGLFTVWDIIFKGGQDPAHPAIECPGCDPLHYGELRAQVLSTIRTLRAAGFHRNDRIAVITPHGPETAVAIISVMAGFTAVPLSPLHTAQEYHEYFDRLRLHAVIVRKDDDTAAAATAASQNIPVFSLVQASGHAGAFTLRPDTARADTGYEFALPSDISNILLTSGTTAQPKIIANTQEKLCITRARQIVPLRITAADRCLHIVPFYHGMGIGLPLLSILSAGGTVICPRDFIPSDFISLLRTCQPTYYTAGPALHLGILREIRKVPASDISPNSLRFILSSSMSLPVDVSRELESLLGVQVVELYASSEIGTISINFPKKPGSVGLPVIENLAVLDEHGRVLGPGQEGEIVARGRTVFSGYDQDPDGSSEAFIGDWCRTGDIGFIDLDGYLYVTGRKKEIINKGGRKIAPAEIDEALMSHPDILEAMAFAVHDPVLGEDVAALVVRKREDLLEEDIREYLLDRLLPTKIPGRIWFVRDIPRNEAGKPLRREGSRRYSRA